MRNFLQEKELRDHEIEDFWVCVREAKDENTRRAAVIVNEFKAYREKLLVRFSLEKYDQNDLFFQPKEDPEQQGIPAAVASEYDEALTTVRNKLMALEITLVDQLEVKSLDFKGWITRHSLLGNDSNIRTKSRRNGLEFYGIHAFEF